jgi:hypothetical protein
MQVHADRCEPEEHKRKRVPDLAASLQSSKLVGVDDGTVELIGQRLVRYAGWPAPA